MFRMIVSIVTVFSLLLSSAEGASLTNVQGAVAVSTGKGFIPVSDGAVLAPGAIVRTGDGAAASIVYDNGCAVPVGPRQQMAVADAPPPCQTAAYDFSGAFGDISASDILMALAVVAGLVAIIIAQTAKAKAPMTQ